MTPWRSASLSLSACEKRTSLGARGLSLPHRGLQRALGLGDSPLSESPLLLSFRSRPPETQSWDPFNHLCAQAVEAPEESHTPHCWVSRASSGETLLPAAPHAVPSRCNSPRPRAPLPCFSDRTPHACVAPPGTAGSPVVHGGSSTRGTLAPAHRQFLLR